MIDHAEQLKHRCQFSVPRYVNSVLVNGTLTRVALSLFYTGYHAYRIQAPETVPEQHLINKTSSGHLFKIGHRWQVKDVSHDPVSLAQGAGFVSLQRYS